MLAAIAIQAIEAVSIIGLALLSLSTNHIMLIRPEAITAMKVMKVKIV